MTSSSKIEEAPQEISTVGPTVDPTLASELNQLHDMVTIVVFLILQLGRLNTNHCNV
jgi:hypothetical protein